MWWLVACTTEERDPIGPSAVEPDEGPVAAESAGGIASPAADLADVEILLDRGAWEDGAWISSPSGQDRLLDPPVPVSRTGAFPRARARLPFGPGVARVHRDGCAPSEVPYTVDLTRTVVLAYPNCAELPGLPLSGTTVLGSHEVTWAEYAGMAIVDPSCADPLPTPGAEEAPARWVDHAHARAWCAWHGWRLPTVEELVSVDIVHDEPVWDGTRERWGDGPVAVGERIAANALPARIHVIDLHGNVAEWTAEGAVAGGSWMSRDFNVRRDVPLGARTDTIGFRCAWDER
jgi:hypothetical protein